MSYARAYTCSRYYVTVWYFYYFMRINAHNIKCYELGKSLTISHWTVFLLFSYSCGCWHFLSLIMRISYDNVQKASFVSLGWFPPLLIVWWFSVYSRCLYCQVILKPLRFPHRLQYSETFTRFFMARFFIIISPPTYFFPNILHCKRLTGNPRML